MLAECLALDVHSFSDPQPDWSLVPTTRSAEKPTEPPLIAVPPVECLTSGQSSPLLSVTRSASLSATLSLAVILWRCMPAPAPAPAPPPSLQGDGMRYTCHQPEMLTTPARSRLTPSPIHNPRRLSLPARAARPEAPAHIAPFLHPAPTSQSSLSPGSAVPRHAKLKKHDTLTHTSLILDTPHGPLFPFPPGRLVEPRARAASLAPGSNLSPNVSAMTTLIGDLPPSSHGAHGAAVAPPAPPRGALAVQVDRSWLDMRRVLLLLLL
jgi:hypothetical protein